MTLALTAALTVALLSVVGAFLFGSVRKAVTLSALVVPVAIGVFLSVVFFELIPEALHEGELYGSIAIAFGFMSFFFLSRVLDTYHHHHDDCHGHHETKRASSMVLIGDSVHNFADGIVIASSFLVNPAVGFATTFGIALHEIPQEIAEFAILLRAGYSKATATLLNLISALSIILGVLVTFLFATFFADALFALLGIAAGNLLYIAASDLLPQLERNSNGAFIRTFLLTTAGLVLMSLLLFWSHEYFGHEEEIHEVEILLEQH